MTVANDVWPPLIVAPNRPSLMWFRDFLITIGMWTIFTLLLATTFNLLMGPVLKHFGLDHFGAAGNWAEFLGRLEPYVLAICALLGSLCIAGLVTIRRRRRALLLATPRLFDLAADANRASMGEGALIQARLLRSSVVNIDDTGVHSIDKAR
jgi:hypothetical protein